MPDGRQQSIDNQQPIHALSEIISPLRLGTYLNATGHDPQRALLMYLWNARVGESFHVPIQAAEVGLRNRASDGIQAVFGDDWWRDPSFLGLAGEKQRADIETVERRLRRQNKPLETGRIIAGLSFGFWIAMLEGRYNPQVWGSQLRLAFPNLPANVDRSRLHGVASSIADLRNRIWHHEPIFRRNLSADYSRCIQFVGWLCPVKAAWIKPHCRVPQMLRGKP